MNMQSDEQIQGQPAPSAPRVNPGEQLRRVREQRGFSIQRVAEELNLTPAVVGFLEDGEFQRLPGHTFARGYIRTYARLLELDQAELVEAFDRFTGTDASGAQVKNLNRIHEPRNLSKIILRLVSVIGLLLLLVLGWSLWQEPPEQLGRLGIQGLRHIEVEKADGGTEVHSLDAPVAVSQGGPIALPLGNPEPQAEEAAQEAPAAADPEPPAAAPVVAPAPVAAPVPVLPAPAVTAQPVVAAAAQPASAGQLRQPLPLNTARPVVPTGRVSLSAIDSLGPRNAPLSLQVPESQRVAAAPVAPPKPEVPAGHGLLQIQFTADCWLKVTDRSGRTQFSGIKRKGETLELTARVPIGLHLGNAGAAQIRFNGEPVGAGQVSTGGTARLTLGQ